MHFLIRYLLINLIGLSTPPFFVVLNFNAFIYLLHIINYISYKLDKIYVKSIVNFRLKLHSFYSNIINSHFFNSLTRNN